MSRQLSTTSAFARRLAELDLDAIGAEIPGELGRMMRTAAQRDGVKIVDWVRTSWADAVNAAGLTRLEVTDTDPLTGEINDARTIAWTFDMALLDPKIAAQRAADQAKAVALKAEQDLAAQRAELEELRAFKAQVEAQKSSRKAA